jgi:hypothetical protein
MKTRTKIVAAVVAVAVLIGATVPALYFTGVIGAGLYRMPTRGYSRPTVPMPESLPAPATLAELLGRDTATVDEVLGDPGIEAELLASQKLTDIVDSRLALRNLRNLQKSARELAAQLPLLSASGKGAEVVRFGTALAPSTLQTKAVAIDAKVTSLLGPSDLPVLGAVSKTDFKAVWTTPDEVRLRWTPHGEWIPADGYKLVRIVDGVETVVAEQLGSIAAIDALTLKSDDLSKAVTELYGESLLTAEKLSTIGVASDRAFSEIVYAKAVDNTLRERVSAERDFAWIQTRLLTVSSTLAQKQSVLDRLGQSAVTGTGVVDPDLFSLTNAKLAINAAIALVPLDTSAGGTGSGSEARDQAVSDLLTARRSLVTRAFVDADFATASGLGHDDDLTSLKLPKGQSLSYRLSVPSGESWTVEVVKGTEQKVETPAGFSGYGMDETVSLRWTAPTDDFDKSVISGYYIERKGPGSGGFKRITTQPIAISYGLDETGIYFEAPVFYEDKELKNGDSATYRLQALDIFGRTSGYSKELRIKVYKVTPPDAPNVDQPVASADSSKRTEQVFRTLEALNKGVTGIIVPIVRSSADTDTLVVYRSVATGAGSFGPPVEVARLPVSLYGDTTVTPRTVRLRGGRLVIAPKNETAIDVAFFDADVRPGQYYKYWAAAVDTWGNESAWSSSKIVGVPLYDAPADPSAPRISMSLNTLPDLSDVAPGFGRTHTDTVSFAALTRGILDAIGSSDGPSAADLLVKGSEKVLEGLTKHVSFGVPVTDLSLADGMAQAELVSEAFGNLPDLDRIQALVAVEQKDLLPDNSARVSWMQYQGDGLGGYAVYRTEIDGTTLAALTATSKETLARTHVWSLVKSGITANLLFDGPLVPKEGRIYLYMVCLIPTAPVGSTLPGFTTDLAGALQGFATGGWVQLAWDAPTDPQVSTYNIYRAEVASFGATVPSDLQWNLVGEKVEYAAYTEKVDQTFAHYYYYKLTSLSVWGLESAGTAPTAFRVPATSPPQTPSMLLPLQKKGAIQVNWNGVPHASKYIVYRTTIPKISEEDIADIQKLQGSVYDGLFQTGLTGDAFLSNRLKPVILPGTVVNATPVLSADKFNTLQQISAARILTAIQTVAPTDKLTVFRRIADIYGPLALAPYGQLSEAAAALVLWEKLTEVPVASGTDSIGLFTYTDTAVKFGDKYLYTVQAANDDELYSGRPTPESASPRKNQAFDAVTGLTGSVVASRPELNWTQAKDANLTWQESREYVAGYIVYRSTEENGFYHQASPLLPRPTWRDESADPYAYNWYKVKVVDTGGYLSEYSSPILVKGTPPFLFKPGTFLDIKPYLPVVRGTSATSSAFATPGNGALAGPLAIIYLPEHYDLLSMGDFLLKDVTLQGPASSKGGTGKLIVGDDRSIDVTLTGIGLNGNTIYAGTANLTKSAVIDESGMHLTRLALTAGSAVASIDGYMTAPTTSGEAATRNLIGDLYSIRFTDAALRVSGKIEMGTIPAFRYGNLLFAPGLMTQLDLSAAEPEGGRIRLFRGSVEYAVGLETVDNIGLGYGYSVASFNTAGKLSGAFALTGTRTLRLVIPAGLGMRVTESNMTWVDGTVDATRSTIKGKLVLPFRTFEDSLPVELDPSVFGGIPQKIDPSFGNLAGIDRLLPEGSVQTDVKTDFSSVLLTLKPVEAASLDQSMLYLGYTIQSTSLLVLPKDPLVQEQMSTVPFDIKSWGGAGFTLADGTMTPALVGNSDKPTGDEIGVTPGHISIDLDRAAFISTEGAPAETLIPFWLGIVVKNGRVSLPSDYIMTDEGKRVFFTLTSGQLLYDLNGITYQNIVVSTEGIPVDFGTALGGFRDVRVFSCMLDLYANKVNVEIRGDMGIPLFGYQRANVKLFTSKELGTLVCTVAETDKFDPSGTGNVRFKVSSGELKPDGLHMNGTLDVAFTDKMTFSDLAFTDLVVPADMEKMTAEGNPAALYGKAIFDTPLLVDFHGFPMEVRSLSFQSTKTQLKIGLLKAVVQAGVVHERKLARLSFDTAKLVDFYPTALTLWGGMQLSDTVAMNTKDNFDRIVFADVMTRPEIRYEESKSKLDLDFEEFSSVVGVVVPKAGSTDSTVVEYDTSDLEMAFDAASSLVGVPIDTNVRLGLDKTLKRYFFAVGIFYNDPVNGGISFGYGQMNEITGIMAYNLALPRSEDGHFAVPKGKGELFAAVDTVKVDTSADGNWFFAAGAKLTLGLGAGAAFVPLGEVRDLYLFVEKGPDVEIGGDFYAPTDVVKIATGGGFSYVGSARISYYHSLELLQFSLMLRDFPMMGSEVTGDLGFDMCPTYWEVRIGYPETLTAKAAGLYGYGFGIAYRDSDLPDDSYIRAKLLFDFDTGDVSIWPVYVRAYLNAGAEGQYFFDSNTLILDVWLHGGAEGGIKAFGRKYAIIHLMIDATGRLTNAGGGWDLQAHVSVYYSLDLWLDEIEGSVDWNIHTTF